jgi:hypothetical protein
MNWKNVYFSEKKQVISSNFKGTDLHLSIPTDTFTPSFYNVPTLQIEICTVAPLKT